MSKHSTVMSVTASSMAPDMMRIVERCREAMERMTWRSDDTAPRGVEAFAGATDDGWTASVMPFKASPSHEAAAGAFTFFKEGLVVHLPEALALECLKLARASATVKT